MTGLASSEINIIDLSLLVGTGIRGIAGVIGATDLGLHGKIQQVGNWDEYKKYYGNLRSDTTFPLLCKRALEAGAKLKITRAGHYTDPANYATLVGVKATASVGYSPTAITIASLTTGTNGTFVVAADLTTKLVVGQTFKVQGANLGNGTYTVITAVFSTPNTTITVASVPAGMVAGTSEVVYSNKFMTFEAEDIGTGYNRFLISTTVNLADDAATDVVIQNVDMPDTMSEATIDNPSLAPSVATFNAAVRYFKITGTTSTIVAAAVGIPTGGTEAINTIVEADYVGATGVNATGIHVFDTDVDITRIAIPEKTINSLDKTLADYVVDRGDLMAIHKTPFGLDGYTAVEYRDCTGAYAGAQPIDHWTSIMFYGGLKCVDPRTQLETEVSVIGDMLGIMSKKDSSKGEWWSYSGQKRGRIKNALGIVYNLGSPARKPEGDLVDVKGLNPVILHPSFGLVAWGNGTLQRASTLLQNANVAELMIFLKRSLKPLVDSELFDPNDPSTWNVIFKRVSQLMEYLKENRAIYDWRFEGDQDATDLTNLTVNNANDVGLGKYKFRLFVKPTPAMKYIKADVAVVNADVDFAAFEDVEL